MNNIALDFNKILSIRINIFIFLIIAIASIILVNKIKLEDKGYKYLFLIYTFFWIPIMLVRPYRGTMQNAIDKEFTTIVIVVYGAVGIFIRIFADWISYIFKYRKAFLYFCVITQTALFIPLVIAPTTATNIISSIGIGIGASCIGTYELLFKEQYGNRKAFLTVSVLSIPPLLANFLTAPVQSIMKEISTDSLNKVDPNILRYMWVISLGFILITFIMLLFLKENKIIVGLKNKSQSYITKSQKNDWLFFLTLSIIGSTIAFIKFTNSDSIATSHLQNLASLNGVSSASYEGYLSVIFSMFQLVAGVLMGMYLIKKVSVTNIFLIGSSAWIIYTIITAFISNPIAYIGIHGINGFGYGILYNLILALVLKITFDNKIITKMGIYQSILAIGITFSGFYTSWVKQIIVAKPEQMETIQGYMEPYFIQNMILLGVIGIMTILFVITMKSISKKTDIFDLREKKQNLIN